MQKHVLLLAWLGLLLACSSKDYCVESGCPSTSKAGTAGQEQIASLSGSGGAYEATRTTTEPLGSGGTLDPASSSGFAGSPGNTNTLSGGAGQSVGLAGSANVAGAPANLSCKGLCTSSKPICIEATEACVECLTSDNCKAFPNRPVCDNLPGSSNVNTCVGCLSNRDCLDPAASFCDTSVDPVTKVPKNTCVPCVGSGDCQHIVGKTVCLPANDAQPSMCVQCTNSNNAACKSTTGETTLCHGVDHTCTEAIPASKGLCDACVSDAQCMDGQVCVQEVFVDTLIPKYACFWKVGAKVSDCTKTQPYSYIRSKVSTIDGDTATICGLGVSTCSAWKEYVSPSIDCAPDGLPVHSLCTFDGVASAKCIQAATGLYQCSPRCSKQYDCLSFSECLIDQGQYACL